MCNGRGSTVNLKRTEAFEAVQLITLQCFDGAIHVHNTLSEIANSSHHMSHGQEHSPRLCTGSQAFQRPPAAHEHSHNQWKLQRISAASFRLAGSNASCWHHQWCSSSTRPECAWACAKRFWAIRAAPLWCFQVFCNISADGICKSLP